MRKSASATLEEKEGRWRRFGEEGPVMKWW